MSNFSATLILLLAIFATSYGKRGFKPSVLNIELGKTYSLRKVPYPGHYKPGYSWSQSLRTRHENVIKIKCDNLNVPGLVGKSCTMDQLTFIEQNQNPVRYCGSGKITFTSHSSTLQVYFKSVRRSPGGWFSCTVSAEPPCHCGHKNRGKITDGVETGINEFPMMASVIDTSRKIVMCGATIINQRQVLTAAHCVQGRTTRNTAVSVGDHDIQKGGETKASRLFRIKSFVVHEQYSNKHPAKGYDIALIEVDGSIHFNNLVGRVCLPFKHKYSSFDKSPVKIVGWGSTRFGNGPSNVLMKATVKVVSNKQCVLKYPKLTNRHICTSAKGKDSCQFDSGGPLLWTNRETGRLVLVGMVSRGSICGQGGFAENTRIGPYLDWIQRNTPRDLPHCKLE